jgi:hypothetical protein
VIGLFALLIRSYRWMLFLSPHHRLSLESLFQATSVGLMTNNILPFRLGDLAQIYFLARQKKLSKSLVLSTVILERLFDFFFPAFILLFGSFFVLFPERLGRGKIIFVLVTVFLVVFLVVRFREKLFSFLEKILPPSDIKRRFKKIVENFYRGFYVLKKKRNWFGSLFYTFFLWGTYSLGTYFVLSSLSIKVPIWGVVLVVAISAISVAIPSSPGYLGTWEFFTVLGLRIFHIPKEEALSFALLNHLVLFLPVTFLGIVVLVKTGVSFLEIERKILKEEEEKIGA